jgi:hypothetical protein
MIPRLRHDFNQRYRPEAYRKMLHSLDACVRTHVKFPVAETPVFVSRSMLDEMSAIGAGVLRRLVNDREYLQSSRACIPPECRFADETPHPHFAAADFLPTRGPTGRAVSRLAHLQAGPLAFGFQFVLNELYRSAYGMDPRLCYFLGGHTEASFWKLLQKTILRGHHPDHVVLAGVHVQEQKLLPDMQVMAERLGLEIVELASLEPDGTRLSYRKGEKSVPVYRVYCYFDPAEMGCGEPELQFDPGNVFDVEWAGHPNWHFHLRRREYEPPRAGHDGEVSIETPMGRVSPEMRILYLWPDAGEPEAVLPQARLKSERGTTAAISAVLFPGDE